MVPFAIVQFEELTAAHVVTPEPLVCRNWSASPSLVGRVSVHVPAAAATVWVTVPLVVPLKFIAPVVPPAVPIVIVEAKVGAVPNTARPVPVSSETESARLAEVIVVARLDDASVVTSLEAVRSGRLTTDEPESIIMLPVVVPPRVNVNIAVD